MILLISGTRTECSYATIEKALVSTGWFGPVIDLSVFPVTQIVQGEADGVDHTALTWAEHNGIDCVGFHANWKKHGKKAGSLRNQSMIDYLCMLRQQGQDVRCIAVPGPHSKGTWDAVKRCQRADIQTYVYKGLLHSSPLSF